MVIRLEVIICTPIVIKRYFFIQRKSHTFLYYRSTRKVIRFCKLVSAIFPFFNQMITLK